MIVRYQDIILKAYLILEFSGQGQAIVTQHIDTTGHRKLIEDKLDLREGNVKLRRAEIKLGYGKIVGLSLQSDSSLQLTSLKLKVISIVPKLVSLKLPQPLKTGNSLYYELSSSQLDTINSLRSLNFPELLSVISLAIIILVLLGFYTKFVINCIISWFPGSSLNPSVVYAVTYYWLLILILAPKLIYTFLISTLILLLFIKFSQMSKLDATSFSSKPHKVFLLLALPMGLYMVLITPPFQAPDEYKYLLRAYQLAKGDLRLYKLTSSEAYSSLPTSLDTFWHTVIESYSTGNSNVNLGKHSDIKLLNDKVSLKELQKLFSIELNKGKTTLFYINLFYSPLSYLPQTLGIWLAYKLNLSPYIGLLAGRISNLLAYILICYIAIAISGSFAELIMLTGLMPGALFLASSLNPAALGNALAFLYIAYVLRLLSGLSVSLKDILLLGLIALGLGSAKPTFAPITLTCIIIPPFSINLRSNISRFAVWLMMVALTLSLSVSTHILWNSQPIRSVVVRYIEARNLNRNLKKLKTGTTTSKERASDLKPVAHDLQGFKLENPDREANLKYLMDSPLVLIRLTWRTVQQNFGFLADSLVAELGWLNYRFGRPLVYLYLLTLLLVSILCCLKVWDNFEPNVRLSLMIGTIFSSLAFISSRFAIMYIHCSPQLADMVYGVSGRYFIPVVPIIALCLASWVNCSLKVLKRLVKPEFLTETMVLPQLVHSQLVASLTLPLISMVWLNLLITLPSRFITFS